MGASTPAASGSIRSTIPARLEKPLTSSNLAAATT